jgi:hypothetical protein
MIVNRSRVLAKLAEWSRLPVGTPDAVDQLRQQLQAFGIELRDRRGMRVLQRALAAAEELHYCIGEEPEYVKRARLNYALARLCEHIELTMTSELVEQGAPLMDAGAQPGAPDKPAA